MKIGADLRFRIEALRLDIRLRMESSRAVGIDAQQLQQPTPKMAGESGIAVADEAGGQPVQAHHLLKKHYSDLRSHHGLDGGNEMRLFGEPVYHHQYSIVVVARR